MFIRLQTCLGKDIPNVQESEMSSFELNSSRALPGKYPRAKFKPNNNPRYNCHGLTFASRRTRVLAGTTVQSILVDDHYVEIEKKDLFPGDIVIYRSYDGEIDHSGVVLDSNQGSLDGPLILSKWGAGPEVIHWVNNVPSIYGTQISYYRCL